MRQISATLTGLAPLLVHSERLANPRDPATRELKELTSRNRGKNKTDELGDQIAEAEWRASMYQENDRPAIPADNILAAVKEAGRKVRLGKQVSAGVFADGTFPIEYDGPTTVDELWEDGRFFDYRSVGVQGKRVMRARPIWKSWQLKIVLSYDEEIVSPRDLEDILRIAGSQIGLCEKRPQFGRFMVSEVQHFELEVNFPVAAE